MPECSGCYRIGKAEAPLATAAPSHRLFLWLDFCHSGGILPRRIRTETKPSAETTIERTLQVIQGTGKVIMCACTADQSAYEDKSHGRFTRYLIDGLKGGANNAQGEITANSLHDYVDSKMGSIDQRPMFFGNQTGRIVLMKSRNIMSEDETLANRVGDRLDFSGALASPKAAYDRAIDLIGNRDKVAWRRLLKAAAEMYVNAMTNWMQSSNAPQTNADLLRSALPGVNTAAELMACLVAAAETEEESYINDLGWIHTVLRPSNWPTGGPTYFVAFPYVVLFLAQAVIGGALMEHGLGETAFNLATFKVRSPYRNDERPIFEARDVNGWLASLVEDSGIAWALLNSVINQWTWLNTGLHRTGRYEVVSALIICFYIFSGLFALPRRAPYQKRRQRRP